MAMKELIKKHRLAEYLSTHKLAKDYEKTIYANYVEGFVVATNGNMLKAVNIPKENKPSEYFNAKGMSAKAIKYPDWRRLVPEKGVKFNIPAATALFIVQQGLEGVGISVELGGAFVKVYTEKFAGYNANVGTLYLSSPIAATMLREKLNILHYSKGKLVSITDECTLLFMLCTGCEVDETQNEYIDELFR